MPADSRQSCSTSLEVFAIAYQDRHGEAAPLPLAPSVKCNGRSASTHSLRPGLPALLFTAVFYSTQRFDTFACHQTALLNG
jgi:hypothetical protein